MNKYTENLTLLVTSIKDTFKKDEVQSPAVTSGSRISKMTKPAKVPFWWKDISLETFTKHITTWTEVNKDVSEYVKFHDFFEKL